MAPQHGEIIRQLQDGWSVAWDATVVDPAKRAAMDQAVEARVGALLDALGEGFMSAIDADDDTIVGRWIRDHDAAAAAAEAQSAEAALSVPKRAAGRS